MNTKEVAAILVDRLNELVGHSEDVRADIEKLLTTKVPASKDTVDHPTIVCGPMWGTSASGLSFLGLLNGALGGGFIGSLWDDRGEGTEDQLVGFVLMKAGKPLGQAIEDARSGEGELNPPRGPRMVPE